MYPILALQAAAMGLVLLVTNADRPVTPARTEPQPAVRAAAPLDSPRMRCRLYFGCTPATGATQAHHD